MSADILNNLKTKIGQELGISEWVAIDQDRINQFADVTIDHQFIHVDAEKAKAFTPFGGTIAHGFLTLSMLSHFAKTGLPPVEGAKMGMNYGLNKVRFLSPVPNGVRIRGRFALTSVEEKNPGQYLISYGVTIEIENGPKPAAIAEWLTLVFT